MLVGTWRCPVHSEREESEESWGPFLRQSVTPAGHGIAVSLQRLCYPYSERSRKNIFLTVRRWSATITDADRSLEQIPKGAWLRFASQIYPLPGTVICAASSQGLFKVGGGGPSLDLSF